MARDDSGSSVPDIVSFAALAAYNAIQVTPAKGSIAAVVSVSGGIGRVGTRGTDGAALSGNKATLADGGIYTVVLVPDDLSTSAPIDFYVAGESTGVEITIQYRGL